MARNISLSATHNENALFKEMYGSGADQSLVNKKAPLASLLMKSKKVDFVGDQFVQPLRFSSEVGLGYRSSGQNLPEPVSAQRAKAIFQAKRAYATAEYDREVIKASRNDKGAFAKVTVETVNAVEEGFMLHNVERALFFDGTGMLGEIESLTGSGTSGSPWVLTMENDGAVAPVYKKRYFEIGQKLDVYSQAGVLQCTVEVSALSSTTITCTLLSTAADSAPANEDVLYWQGNKGLEITGLRAIAPASAGTIYGLSQTTYPKMMGTVLSLSGAQLDFGDLNDMISDLEEEIGAPDIGVCSYTALRILKNQAEDAKRYNVAEAKSVDAKIGFKGVEVMTSDGPIPLIASPMCPDDEIFFLDKKNHLLVMREDFGWFDDDGTILLRDPSKDVYSARYGGYFEHFCSKPNSVGRIKGFATT